MKLPLFGPRPRKAKEPSAALYLRGTRIVVHSRSKTDVGVWVACAPFITLTSDTSDQELGEAVLAAMAGSKENVPHPPQSEWRSVVTPLLKASGTRSWKVFAQGAVSVSLRQRENTMLLMPMENQGPKNGFAEKLGSELSVSADSAQEVGAVLREALKLAS